MRYIVRDYGWGGRAGGPDVWATAIWEFIRHTQDEVWATASCSRDDVLHDESEMAQPRCFERLNPLFAKLVSLEAQSNGRPPSDGATPPGTRNREGEVEHFGCGKLIILLDLRVRTDYEGGLGGKVLWSLVVFQVETIENEPSAAQTNERMNE